MQQKRINNKKTKNKQKVKDLKDCEERTAIVKETIDKLIEVNLAALDENDEVYSGFEGVEQFLKILEEYKKPVLYSGFSGIIKIPELKRNIEYILPLKNLVDHGVRLVSDDPKNYIV
jgi:flagellar biosynthesis/type III secretory pathway chaperone